MLCAVGCALLLGAAGCALLLGTGGLSNATGCAKVLEGRVTKFGDTCWAELLTDTLGTGIGPTPPAAFHRDRPSHNRGGLIWRNLASNFTSICASICTSKWATWDLRSTISRLYLASTLDFLSFLISESSLKWTPTFMVSP